MSYLDYNLKTSEERIECAQRYLNSLSEEQKTQKMLDYIGDYILFVRDKGQTIKERKEEYPTPTKNRETTINKRQTSLEELISNFENGEDGLYGLIADNKNQLLDHKTKISEEEFDRIPALREKKEIIDRLSASLSSAKGKQRYYIKKQIIETWQEIYALRNSGKGYTSSRSSGYIRNMAHMDIPENITIDENGILHSDAILSLINPDHVSFLLSYYSQLKEESYEDVNGDMHWLLYDLEETTTRMLQNPKQGTVSNAVLEDLIIWKVDGCSNEEIQKRMESKYGIVHNEQYYSTLWRKRIPKLIAEQAQKDHLIWYYSNKEYHDWKQCTKCHEWKPAHQLFFSRNSTKSGWYSICKDCR